MSSKQNNQINPDDQAIQVDMKFIVEQDRIKPVEDNREQTSDPKDNIKDKNAAGLENEKKRDNSRRKQKDSTRKPADKDASESRKKSKDRKRKSSDKDYEYRAERERDFGRGRGSTSRRNYDIDYDYRPKSAYDHSSVYDMDTGFRATYGIPMPHLVDPYVPHFNDPSGALGGYSYYESYRDPSYPYHHDRDLDNDARVKAIEHDMARDARLKDHLSESSESDTDSSSSSESSNEEESVEYKKRRQAKIEISEDNRNIHNNQEDRKNKAKVVEEKNTEDDKKEKIKKKDSKIRRSKKENNKRDYDSRDYRDSSNFEKYRRLYEESRNYRVPYPNTQYGFTYSPLYSPYSQSPFHQTSPFQPPQGPYPSPVHKTYAGSSPFHHPEAYSYPSSYVHSPHHGANYQLYDNGVHHTSPIHGGRLFDSPHRSPEYMHGPYSYNHVLPVGMSPTGMASPFHQPGLVKHHSSPIRCSPVPPHMDSPDRYIPSPTRDQSPFHRPSPLHGRFRFGTRPPGGFNLTAIPIDEEILRDGYKNSHRKDRKSEKRSRKHRRSDSREEIEKDGSKNQNDKKRSERS